MNIRINYRHFQVFITSCIAERFDLTGEAKNKTVYRLLSEDIQLFCIIKPTQKFRDYDE